MKVPEYSPQAKLNGLPNVRQSINTSASDFLDPTAAMIAPLGQALHHVEHDLAANYRAEKQKADKIRAQQALFELQKFDQDQALGKNGWRNVQGADVFSQQNSKPLTDNVLDARSQYVGELMDGLGNEDQKNMFVEHANQSGIALRGQLLGHEAEQYRVYQRGTLQAGIETNTKQATLFYNDEAQVQQAIDNVMAFSTDLGKLEHGSEEIGKSNGQRSVSNMLNSAIDAALYQRDHASATRLLHKFAPHMDSNDMLKAAKLITEEQDKVTAVHIATATIGDIYPRMVTGDFDRMANLTEQAESGGKRYGADGKLLESEKGAKGEMQVMDGTNRDPGFGVKPAQDNSPDERARVGRDYLRAMLTEFGNDKAKAWAAYNAGPGATKKAIEEASKDGSDWLSKLHAETQVYVTKLVKAYDENQGHFQRPTLRDVQQEALAKLGKASPELQKKTLDLVEQRYNDELKSIKERDEYATAEAYDFLSRNKGDMSQLPSKMFDAVPPEKRDDMLNFAKRMAEGKHIETNWPLYYQLKTDQQLLHATNLAAIRDKLGDSEFKELVKEQADVRSGEGLTKVRSAGDVLKTYMLQSGLDPNSKDEADQEKMGRIWSAYEEAIREQERTGGKLDVEGYEKVAAKLFTKVALNWSMREKPAVLLTPDDDIEIPEKEINTLYRRLQSAYPNKDITMRDIRALYLKTRG